MSKETHFEIVYDTIDKGKLIPNLVFVTRAYSQLSAINKLLYKEKQYGSITSYIQSIREVNFKNE